MKSRTRRRLHPPRLHKQCIGKAPYADPGAARRARPFVPGGRRLMAYQCGECQHWHLGH